MNVLSLFDGMSCGQIALRELGVSVDRYYASEVDKHAIAQTMLNFPETIQLGDVRYVDARKLGKIDLLIGGSPCQSFSFVGNRAGMSTKENEDVYTLERYMELKRDGFEFEGQSYLFWEFVRILHELREVNPNVLFLLENVEMGKKWETVISNAIGLHGVHIDSALVSAQSRKRIYWTNIRTFNDGLFGETFTDIPQPKDRGLFLRDVLEKEVSPKYHLSERMISWLNRHAEKRDSGISVMSGDEKSHCITSTAIYKGNLTTDYVQVEVDGKSTLRKYTPLECARLQTVPDWYKFGCSDTQAYRMIGNGWTVEVIKHILSFMNDRKISG